MPTIPASHTDLLEKNQVVILTTKGHDGFPQTTALWFLLNDDGTIQLSINTARQKAINLQRNPECTLFFMDPETPYRTLEIRALARIDSDPEYAVADKVGERYGANLRNMDQPGESRIAVSFTIVKVNTFGEPQPQQ